MVFGKSGWSTRFNTTVATATFPANGSPFASAWTRRANKSLSLAEMVGGMSSLSPGNSQSFCFFIYIFQLDK